VHSEKIQEEQHLNRVMLDKEQELLELLEIPNLMDTCARNGLFEEALDLEAFAASLADRSPDIPILGVVVGEMEDTIRRILAQLLDQLRNPIQLSTCLRVVSYLRRLNVLSEQGLREEFLRSRNAWLEVILDNVGSPDINRLQITPGPLFSLSSTLSSLPLLTLLSSLYQTNTYTHSVTSTSLSISIAVACTSARSASFYLV
jgi:hypothetical protein